MTSVGDDLESARGLIRESVVWHWYFSETKQKVTQALEADRFLFLVGSAGVGKGTLVREMVKEWNAPVEGDRRLLRAAMFRAPSAHGTMYPWIAWYTGSLDELKDPFPEQKIDRGRVVAELRSQSRMPTVRGSVDDLRRTFFKAVRDRGIEVLFIDEALNMLVNDRGRTFRNQLDILRDLHDEVGCKVVLVSTPRILNVLEELGLSDEALSGESLTGELLRRVGIRYFRRYGLARETWVKESRAYRKIVKLFLMRLPESFRPELSPENFLSLQIDSMGSVGLLVRWLLRAVSLCEAEQAERLVWRHFEETSLTDVEFGALERRYRKDDETVARLSKRSGCGAQRKVKSADTSPENETGASGKRRGQRVGTPAARRPPLGNGSK